MKIVVYGAPGCGQCLLTEKALKRKSIEFEKRDFPTQPQQIKDAFIADGLRALPIVVVYDNEIVIDKWTGFRPDFISKLTP